MVHTMSLLLYACVVCVNPHLGVQIFSRPKHSCGSGRVEVKGEGYPFPAPLPPLWPPALHRSPPWNLCRTPREVASVANRLGPILRRATAY